MQQENYFMEQNLREAGKKKKYEKRKGGRIQQHRGGLSDGIDLNL